MSCKRATKHPSSDPEFRGNVDCFLCAVSAIAVLCDVVSCAQLATAREQERVINRYMSEVALKLAQAAVDWAGKVR